MPRSTPPRPAIAAFAFLWFMTCAAPHAVPDIAADQEAAHGAVARRIDEYLTRLVPYGFSGAVLVARHGEVLLKQGYGLANAATKQPYTPDLVSSIGSITKLFTAAAILKLEMVGRLTTSDPIARHLPAVPSDKAGITIHHLLTHTAGFSGDLGGSDDEPLERDALVARVLAAPLVARPGERFEYSNEGYSLAGAIVERVSGQGYEAFLREHVFLPAGMPDTGYQTPGWPLERIPVGYGQDGREWGRIYRRGWLPDGPGWYLRANGGLHSTLEDLYRWHLALERGTVLSSEATRKYLTGHVPTGQDGEQYGYGWGVQKTRRGTSVISHNGGNGFIFSDFRRYVDEGVVIIAMTNHALVPAPRLAPRELEALVFGDRPVVMPPKGVDVAPAAREGLAGTYTLDDGSTVTLRSTERGLEAEASDPTLFAATPLAPPGGRFASLETRTLALLRSSAAGDFRPLYEAFAVDRPYDVVAANQQRIWDDWRAALGEFREADVLGTTLVDGDPAAVVRLRFSRGDRIVECIWGPRRLAGFRVRPPDRPVLLVAESPSSWIYYAYRLPHPIGLTVRDDGSLTITRGDATITGRRP